MNLDFSMVTPRDIFEYFVALFRTVISFFGIKFEDGTSDNLESMFDNITGYQPEV